MAREIRRPKGWFLSFGPRPILVGLALASIIASTDARAQERTEIFLYGAAELWGPELAGHGIVMAAVRGPIKDLRYWAYFNTDTLLFRVDEIRTGHVTFGVQAKGELFIAGLLPDYYVGGENIAENGFRASYVEVQADVKAGWGRHFVDYSLTPRRWFFATNDATVADLALPPDTWSFINELGYTYWAIESDTSWYQPHRITLRRVRGFGAGVRLLGSYRLDASSWGAPGDTRNDPNPFNVAVRQWARYGVQYTPALRLQFREEAGWGWGEDDLMRQRVGGMNAYVVPIAGVPWAGFLASRYVTGRVGQMINVFGETEVGVVFDVAYLQDIHRSGDLDSYGVAIGLGAVMDMRFGPWQIEAQFGWSPDIDWQAEKPMLSGYIGLGWGR